jgi:hypothetical protein
MEIIDLDVWIFTPGPWWMLTVVVYDSDLEWGSREIERTMVTQETQGFLDRFIPHGG